MTKQEIKTARKEVQKLIKENKTELLRRIKKDYLKLIRLIKNNYDVDNNNLLDEDFYEEIEHCLTIYTRR
jgi:hypothetical protein